MRPSGFAQPLLLHLEAGRADILRGRRRLSVLLRSSRLPGHAPLCRNTASFARNVESRGHSFDVIPKVIFGWVEDARQSIRTPES